MKKVEDYVVSIPDFPEPGIIFRDVTSVLQDADGLHLAIDLMQEKLEGLEFDVIAGAESRGFIFGTPLAYNLNKPFVLVRKAGKLPCETVSMEYDPATDTAENAAGLRQRKPIRPSEPGTGDLPRWLFLFRPML